jgi:hypothetical protein
VTTVRLRRVSLRLGLATGAVTGFVVGLFVGCVLGALTTWIAGALLDWQRQLAFTLGVTNDLLPLGEQVGLLQSVQAGWWYVVPLCGLVVGGLSALAGALGTALFVALFNRYGEGTEVDVENGAPSEVAAQETGSSSRKLRLASGERPSPKAPP